MFVGAINSITRKFLADAAPTMKGKVVVVGCSGNFTSEAVLTKYGEPAAIHSNDVSLYSCMMGRWLTKRPLDFEMTDSDYSFVEPHLEKGDTQRLAVIMVLLNMLEFDKRNNHHVCRMWQLHRLSFDDLVEKTTERLERSEVKITSFYEGDVWDHFKRFEADAVFCCYAPTYAGGYERLYKRLERIISWDAPGYEFLDDQRRNQLLDWMAARRFLWYDDRMIDSMEPAMKQETGGTKKTVYLYSNVITRHAYFNDQKSGPLLKLPLADKEFVITPDSVVALQSLKTSELRKFKEAFLGKNINHTAGMWAFAVMVDRYVVGFCEFSVPRYDYGALYIYMLSDFAIPGTRYKRLSKLVLMIVKSRETKRILERKREKRTFGVATTAFTERPVSMKYRGVFKLKKRGATKEGQKFLNYTAEFNDLTWQETLREWLTKHGSKVWSKN